ncbi:hypothetical protein K2Z84_06165 [Candidatus Binatia bacterium]|nr:hypothetical protein [Candidatus Binatia bacterium]
MKPGFWSYVRAAFSARPLGMPIPPNWLFLAAIVLLGTIDRGFLVLGAGLELAYLGLLSGNERFRRTVRARAGESDAGTWSQTVQRLAQQLSSADRERYEALDARCRAILEGLERATSLDAAPVDGDPAGAATDPGSTAALDSASASLGRLSWMYLRLLVTRQAIHDTLTTTGNDASDAVRPRSDAERAARVRSARGAADPGAAFDRELEERLRTLQRQLDDEALASDLRGSLSGQAEILQQRLAHRAEARERLAFLDAELARIEQQVELVREQAVGAPDAEAVSRRIDDIAATLGGTATWIREQQKIYGGVSDLLTEPPATARPQTRRMERA